jgi:hypothetical protein
MAPFDDNPFPGPINLGQRIQNLEVEETLFELEAKTEKFKNLLGECSDEDVKARAKLKTYIKMHAWSIDALKTLLEYTRIRFQDPERAQGLRATIENWNDNVGDLVEPYSELDKWVTSWDRERKRSHGFNSLHNKQQARHQTRDEQIADVIRGSRNFAEYCRTMHERGIEPPLQWKKFPGYREAFKSRHWRRLMQQEKYRIKARVLGLPKKISQKSLKNL